MGVANIKVIAVGKGTPFKTKRRTIGTIPQSHTGKIPPRKQAMMILKNLLLGRTFLMAFSETKLLSNAETITLSSIKGKASITMLSKIILKLIRLFQLIRSDRFGDILVIKLSRRTPPKSLLIQKLNDVLYMGCNFITTIEIVMCFAPIPVGLSQEN
jgi:hypothetical protein